MTLGAGADIGPLAVDERGGRAYVVVRGPTGRVGHVAVLDAATGTVRRAIPVGLDPRDVTVDGRGGRVVVVNAGGGGPGLAPRIAVGGLARAAAPVAPPRAGACAARAWARHRHHF